MREDRDKSGREKESILLINNMKPFPINFFHSEMDPLLTKKLRNQFNSFSLYHSIFLSPSSLSLLQNRDIKIFRQEEMFNLIKFIPAKEISISFKHFCKFLPREISILPFDPLSLSLLTPLEQVLYLSSQPINLRNAEPSQVAFISFFHQPFTFSVKLKLAISTFTAPF